MPARAANNPALIPTARHAPESTRDSKSEKRVGSRLRADSASHEDGNHGCSVCARPGRPRNNIQLAPAGASGPDAKSGLRAQGAKRGVGSVAGSRKGAPGPSGRPPPARILARPHPPICAKWGEVIMEAAWGARRGGVLCLQTPKRVVIIVPLGSRSAAGNLLPQLLLLLLEPRYSSSRSRSSTNDAGAAGRGGPRDDAHRHPQRCQCGRHRVRRPVRPLRCPHVANRLPTAAGALAALGHDQFTKKSVRSTEPCPPLTVLLEALKSRH